MAVQDHATPFEIAVIFGFLCAVVFVLYGGVRLFVFELLYRGKKPRPRFWPVRSVRAERWLNRGLALAFVLGVGCILYGFLVEPRNIEVTRLVLKSNKIHSETERIRLVHISDLHSEAEGLNEARAVEIVNKLGADLVLITGDFINDEGAVPLVRKTLGALKSSFGVYLVKGNMDLGVLPDGAFAGLPVAWLDKEARELNIRGTRVRLSGMAVGDEPYFKRFRKNLGPTSAYDIFLFHYSTLIYEADKAGVDLYLAGHTHGGQVRLPFYGALITFSTLGKRFEAGRYQVGGTTLYVNRGLGMAGDLALRVRFLCRPEITVLDIVPQ